MLAAGFTTVQSVGSPLDKDLRDAIDRLGLPGPRILTSLDPIFGRGDATGTPDELRAVVQRHAKDGADVIKIFASGSIREGGKPTLSQDQLNAICGEAKKAGLRTSFTLTVPRCAWLRWPAARKSSTAFTPLMMICVSLRSAARISIRRPAW